MFDFPPVDEARGQACIAALREVAAKHDTSVASVALEWILAKPFVMSVIIGAKNMEQLDQNIASTEMTLDAEDLARLESVSAMPYKRPGRTSEHQKTGADP